MRVAPLSYAYIPSLSSVESVLRNANSTHRDRQLRVKLEAYEVDPVIEEPPVKKRKTDSSATVKKVESKPVSTVAIFKSVLNSVFPGYDFDAVRSDQIAKKHLKDVMQEVRSNFIELSSGDDTEVKTVLFDLWKEIKRNLASEEDDCQEKNRASLEQMFPEIQMEVGSSMESLNMSGVEIYSYVSDENTDIDADPLSSFGDLWSFNFFFCNKERTKTVFLACSCRQRKFSQGGDTSGIEERNSFFETWDEEEEEESNSLSISELIV